MMGIIVVMFLLWGLWVVRPVPFLLIVVIVAVWGGLAFWNAPAIQARLCMVAGSVAPQALALNTSGTYLGVSIGAAVGGVSLSAGGVGSLPLTAGGWGVVAVIMMAAASTSVDRWPL